MGLSGLKVAAIGLLPRGAAVRLGLRRLSPADGYVPMDTIIVPAIDTGGAFRCDWRKQDPSADPKEPYGSESSGTGNDHGWSNCTMTSAGLAYAYETNDQTGPWGGDMRHKQDDMSGGTDLYDARTAWDRYGNKTLTIKSGAGWSAVKTAHDEKRAIIIQGTGNVPGSESFDGSHACVIAPETQSDGDWLFGDPLATGWQWIAPSAIEKWAKALNSSIYFAVGRKQPTETPPPTTPNPPEEPSRPPTWFVPDCEPAIIGHDDEVVRQWYMALKADPDATGAPVTDALAMIADPFPHWDDSNWRQTIWPVPAGSALWDNAVWPPPAAQWL